MTFFRKSERICRMIREKDDVLKDLEPIMPDIKKAFDAAFTEYRNDILLTGQSLKSSKRTIASYISDLIWNELKNTLGDKHFEGIYLRDENGSKILQYKDYIIRFKKLDKKGRASNLQTQNSDRFYTPLFDMPLFSGNDINGKKGLNVVFGYKTNFERTEFEYPFLMHPKNVRQIEWIVNLSKSIELNSPIRLPNKIEQEIFVSERTGKVRAKSKFSKIDIKRKSS